ncbi:MAG: hypothetical protein B6U86_01800 [Candidatus Altiarchaeales archaeon ex4484_43]|nr:MAG: hypothetical protein B6U86_01800 [Candidatus Altiarchaeales archaeon ex4484_43]
MGALAIGNLWFPFFVAIALIFTIPLFYSVRAVSHSGKGFTRSKVFPNTDPIIRAFYQFFIGAAFAYILFLMYFIDMEQKTLFILAELALGHSLIGFGYLTIPMFLRRCCCHHWIDPVDSGISFWIFCLSLWNSVLNLTLSKIHYHLFNLIFRKILGRMRWYRDLKFRIITLPTMKIFQVKRCGNCDRVIPIDSKFYPYCGEILT